MNYGTGRFTNYRLDTVPARAGNWIPAPYFAMPGMVLAVWEECRLLPAPLQSRVRTLDAWHVTEARLRALTKERGATR